MTKAGCWNFSAPCQWLRTPPERTHKIVRDTSVTIWYTTHIISPLLLPKEMYMTKTAYIMMVSLFASGLCITPFSMAAPAKQSKTAACNAQANDKGLGEEKDEETKKQMCGEAAEKLLCSAADARRLQEMTYCFYRVLYFFIPCSLPFFLSH